MFKVRLAFNLKEVRTVYAVQQLENGLTQFLVWDDLYNKWVWVPANEYVPAE
ncbi:hypothetical protein [Paenibacillus rigui]|uniref:hypothetical protein n=1 Tax=Paenibacillus rigui TaxID=554312 RepID=UPI0015C62009|nr:hypothetical protein [Paenibacillus rigui]